VDEIDVVLPCLDEAVALPGVLRALPPGFRERAGRWFAELEQS
jgi:hypothetical protein